MKRLLIHVPNCEVVPRGYGLVYIDYLRMEKVCAPVPLHFMLACGRAAWIWMRHGFYTREMGRRERELAVSRMRNTQRFYNDSFVVAGIASRQRRAGVLFRWGSFWIGAHWSPANRRLCLNLVPCVTIWVVAPGGVAP